MPVRRKRKMNFAAKVYLSGLVTENYRKLSPAWRYAKNTDLLWFLVPITGFSMFIQAIESRQ